MRIRNSIYCGYIFSLLAYSFAGINSFARENTSNLNDLNAGNNLWKVEFKHNDITIDSETFILEFEVFVNQKFHGMLRGTIKEINQVLHSHSLNSEISDKLDLVFLNHDRATIKQILDREEKISFNEQVFFEFFGKSPFNYSFEYIPKKDFFFFYVEKSGGIHNLRKIRDFLDNVIEQEHHFLVYFNNSGRSLIATEPEGIRRFYNEVFSSVTQPPVLAEESRRISRAIIENLPPDAGNLQAHFFFYLSESSFGMMNPGFIDSILNSEAIKRLGNISTVSIATDFKVANQRKEFKYINLSLN